MNAEQLQQFIEDMVVFLAALDKAIPNKVDEELQAFLKGLQAHPWIMDLLVATMSAVSAKNVRSAGR